MKYDEICKCIMKQYQIYLFVVTSAISMATHMHIERGSNHPPKTTFYVHVAISRVGFLDPLRRRLHCSNHVELMMFQGDGEAQYHDLDLSKSSNLFQCCMVLDKPQIGVRCIPIFQPNIDYMIHPVGKKL